MRVEGTGAYRVPRRYQVPALPRSDLPECLLHRAQPRVDVAFCEDDFDVWVCGEEFVDEHAAGHVAGCVVVAEHLVEFFTAPFLALP